MQSIRVLVLFLTVFALGACAPEVIGGGADTVSITAGPLTDVHGIAKKYCRGYGKRAVLLGDGPLGPSTVKRLYAYDCVSPADPHD